MVITAEMAHEHAHHDVLFVALSLGLALVGSFAALVSAIRIPRASGGSRRLWVAASAVSLGGGAIWAMHFMGMLGYHVADRKIAYDLPLTAFSLLLAIGVSAVGMKIVGNDPGSRPRLVFSGALAGLGVGAMHYTGMAAMRVGSTVRYDPLLVGASIAIAVVAATAAFWILFRVRTGAHVVVASVVMAAAVCGMHYTGMAATTVPVTENVSPVSGADPIALTFFVCVLAFSVLALIIFAAFGGLADSGGAFAPSARPDADQRPDTPKAGSVFTSANTNSHRAARRSSPIL
ncbi:histidine kinase [Frankia sp. CNm7]|uniref:Histidine kinase n=1 Tax=Frankia nepalensis TaxID=1836974 RepID=A0A937RJG9_9ACTN|nr:MHYT domain-containing protein [Frankia nepalensis]MBL7501292.1 histidine kinase [Frankia nepalensis]MBL7510139.1 histidine kinase [Frankia nepalensis]MBL7520290.1 histidine kinase [Frankia nepalensis]MBL7627086.1 histidine kinase [Frankia nepalensis]